MQGKSAPLALNARSEAAILSLNLLSLKPPVIHGKAGISKKGEGLGQASYYVSYTDLETRGWLQIPGQSSRVEVKGVSWFDHEFGSNQLTPDQAGWDWLGLHLSDGRELMLYLIRRTDGSVEPASSGTVVDPTGAHRHLALSQIRITVLDHWRSVKSGAYYPSRWRIIIPTEGIELEVRPVLADQELLTPETTGVTYWEGAVEGRGLARNRDVTCTGYVELTGYGGKLGGLF
jgi:predicted secreted hydrolase